MSFPTEDKIPVGTTGKFLRVFSWLIGASTVSSEAVSLADPVDPDQVAKVTAADAAAADSGVVVKVAPSTKTLAEASGILTGAGSVTLAGLCVGGRVFANGVDSSFKTSITGATVHTVRNGSGFDLNLPNFSNPTITWVSGALDVSLFCLQ